MSNSTVSHALFYSGLSGFSGLQGFSGYSGIAGIDRIYLGYISRDMTLASGTQTITGVGFQPKLVIINYGIQFGSAQNGWIIWGGNVNEGGFYRHANGAYYPTDAILMMNPTAGDYQVGDLGSFNSDGFTINWTKTGSPVSSFLGYFGAIG